MAAKRSALGNLVMLALVVVAVIMAVNYCSSEKRETESTTPPTSSSSSATEKASQTIKPSTPPMTTRTSPITPAPTAGDTRSSTTKPTSTPDTTGRYTITGDGWFGCVSQQDFLDISAYRSQGDKTAFTNALSARMASGIATIFKKGEVVFLADTKIFSGIVQVRREGETTKYWTNLEAISDD